MKLLLLTFVGNKCYPNSLSKFQLELLKNRLMEQWLGNCNNVILFTWISFLQVEVLEYLDIKFPLIVEPEKMRILTDYNLQRLHLKNKNGFLDCQ